MGKPRLASLKPQLPTLAPQLGYAPGDQKARNDFRVGNEPWRRWYRTKRWYRLRASVLVDDLYTCRMCKLITRNGEAVCDHKIPHHGNARLFWDRSNLQCLCAQCHNGRKQREEKSWTSGRGNTRAW